MNEHRGKLDFQIKDWSKVKYMVKCTWGVHVNCLYPNPVIKDYYFEEMSDVQNFVSEYYTNNGSETRKIIMIIDIARFLTVEAYEVATKVRVVAQ